MKLTKHWTILKGKHYINFVIGDLNAKNTAWWGDVSAYPGEAISDVTGLREMQFSVPSYVTNLCYNKLKSQLAYHYST